MDLFCFKNEKEKTEVHVLNGENNFKSFLFEYKTALHNFDNSFEFKIGNFKNPIPDIYCIKKNKTGSQSTEIHILSGKERYESYLNNFDTVLHETDDKWTFGIGEYNQNFDRYNIYCIKKRTKSKKMKIKILNCSDYKSFIGEKIITCLPECDNNWEFLLRDYNHDGKLDLYCINKKGQNNSVEINILSGDSNFKTPLLKKNIDLGNIDDNYQFCAGSYGGYECIFQMKKNEMLEILIFVI
jgi:hypothetical protein